jgi:hypothetical protein
MKDKAGVLICSLIAFSAWFGPDEDFSIIVLPDTQFYSASMNGGSPEIFEAETDSFGLCGFLRVAMK